MREYNPLSVILKQANTQLRSELLARRIRGLVVIEYEYENPNKNGNQINDAKANQAQTPSHAIEHYLTHLNQSYETFKCDDDLAMRNIPKTLGIERNDVIFDALKGFDLNAFAALAGSLKAGSICWLIVPDAEQWRNTPDQTSLRWNNFTYSKTSDYKLNNTELTNLSSKQDPSKSIIPYNFIRHFHNCLITSEQIYRITLKQQAVIESCFIDLNFTDSSDINSISIEPKVSKNLGFNAFFYSQLLNNYYLALQQTFSKAALNHTEFQNTEDHTETNRGLFSLDQESSDKGQNLSIRKKVDDTHNNVNVSSELTDLDAIANNQPTYSQRKILEACLNSQHHLHLLLAKRGRGKSWLVAELIKQCITRNLSYTLTAPNKRATKLALTAQDKFIAPDELTRLCHTNIKNPTQPISHWLIVDEAAMLPIAWLKLWHKHFSQVLLVSTTEGYEGSGQGLRNKLLNANLLAELFTLETPIRYAQGDPLEAFVERICATPTSRNLETERFLKTESVILQMHDSQLSKNTTLPQNPSVNILSSGKSSSNSLPEILALYQLLYSAHYQTTPTDLRRILDAQHQQLLFLTLDFVTPSQQSPIDVSDKNHQQNLSGKLTESEQLIAGCWVLEEGGADILLAKAIWAGKRRPKGNLVAQSLTAHAGMIEAAMLKSWRITRIAVKESHRRNRFASKLIDHLKSSAKQKNIDYLSVSFGYEAMLFTFWQENGFVLQHISFSKDISSGGLSCMMILPISQTAQTVAERGYQQLMFYYDCPDYFQLKLEPERFLLIKQLIEKQASDDLYHKQNHFMIKDATTVDDFSVTEFTCHELHLLYGFAKQHRAIDTVLPILSKLNLHTKKTFSNKKNLLLNDSLHKLSTRYAATTNKKIIHNKQLVINEVKQAVLEWLTEFYPEAITKFDNWLISDNLNTLYFK